MPELKIGSVLRIQPDKTIWAIDWQLNVVLDRVVCMRVTAFDKKNIFGILLAGHEREWDYCDYVPFGYNGREDRPNGEVRIDSDAYTY